MKDKLKGFFGGEETTDVAGEEGYYTTSREEFHEQNGLAGSKMMLLEPRAYSESQQIADYLKNRSSVVVNLKRVTPDQAKRIVDFLYGGIFLCTPNNVNVEGKISEDNGTPAKSTRGKKAEKADDDEDFF